jgi:hypothetical protein
MTIRQRAPIRGALASAIILSCLATGVVGGSVSSVTTMVSRPSVTIVDAGNSASLARSNAHISGAVYVENPELPPRVSPVISPRTRTIFPRRRPGDAPTGPVRVVPGGGAVYTDADAVAEIRALYPDARPASAEGECGEINWGEWVATSTPPPPDRSLIQPGGWLGFIASSIGDGGKVIWYGCYA